MIALGWAVAAAFAFEWDFYEAPVADEMTVHLCLGDFTDVEVDRIFTAADAWRAGDGQALRGAAWAYLRGPDQPDGSCAPGNGVNEIYAEDEDWFRDHDAGGAIATTLNDDVDRSAEVDFVWNSGDAARWSTARPSRTADGELSLGMIALHEFGHGLGFNHDNAAVAVMNDNYPNGGDLGGGYHPHADDHAGLVAHRPDPSTGANLLLGKFVEEPGDPGDAIELWDEATSAWTVCREEVDGASGPEAIYAHLHDPTGAEVRPQVVWHLSEDDRCFDGLEYEVGREEAPMVPGGPVSVRPARYDFGGVPAGAYHLCARIDADAVIAEVDERDNTVRSEALVTVEDCP